MILSSVCSAWSTRHDVLRCNTAAAAAASRFPRFYSLIFVHFLYACVCQSRVTKLTTESMPLESHQTRSSIESSSHVPAKWSINLLPLSSQFSRGAKLISVHCASHILSAKLHGSAERRGARYWFGATTFKLDWKYQPLECISNCALRLIIVSSTYQRIVDILSRAFCRIRGIVRGRGSHYSWLAGFFILVWALNNLFRVRATI